MTLSYGGVVIHVSILDLVATVAYASTNATDEVVNWLSCERISQGAFLYAMSFGQNLAQSDIHGFQVLNGLEATLSRLHGLPLTF